MGRLLTKFSAFRKLYFLSKQEVETFLNSFGLFSRVDGVSDRGDWESGKSHATFMVDSKDTQQLLDYYGVLNRLCALGNVEKMYIPPLLDEKKGVYENQLLFEEKLVNEMGLDRDSVVLELGCGVGKIAEHIQTCSGATVYGLNIDPIQIHVANRRRVCKKLKLQVGNFNERLPFDDETFDAVYAVQPLTYVHDLDILFKEVYRILKPGGRCCYLDAVMKGDFHNTDAKEHQLFQECRQVVGLGGFWFQGPEGGYFTSAMERSGFTILKNYDMSINGVQGPLIKREMQHFRNMEVLLKRAERYVPCLVPKHLSLLSERLNHGIGSFIEMDERQLITTSWFISATKPTHSDM